MRIIALDIGTVRTGFAFGDTELGLALVRPEVLLSQNLIQFLEVEFSRTPFSAILFGLPKNRMGEKTAMTELVEQTITTLQQKFPKTQVYTVDERLTSQMAARNLTKNSYLDNEAARIMLQEWLDRHIRSVF